jgi:hypothetical protein
VHEVVAYSQSCCYIHADPIVLCSTSSLPLIYLTLITLFLSPYLYLALTFLYLYLTITYSSTSSLTSPSPLYPLSSIRSLSCLPSPIFPSYASPPYSHIPLSHPRLQQLLRVLCAWHCDEFNSPLDRGVLSRILQVLPLFAQSSFSSFVSLHSCLERPFPLPFLSPLFSLLTFLLISVLLSPHLTSFPSPPFLSFSLSSFLHIHLPLLSPLFLSFPLLSPLFLSSLSPLFLSSPLLSFPSFPFLSSPSPLFPSHLFSFCQISSSKGDGVLAGIAIKVKIKIRTALHCTVLCCAVLYKTLPSFLPTPLPPVCTLSAVTYSNPLSFALSSSHILSYSILSQLLIKYGYPVQRSDYLCCAHACLGEK